VRNTRQVKKETRGKHLSTQTYINIKIISSPKTRTLLHISGINRHPQGDV